jgi:KDO2-lipid IV(A) lauroyltransferase
MARSKRIRHLVEYVLLKGALGTVDRLSPAALARLAERLANIAYPFARARHRVAVENVLRAGLATDRAGAERIARASFRHVAVMAAEALRAPAFFSRHPWREYVDLQLSPGAERAIEDRSQGVILVSGHFGNWEIPGQVLSTIRPVLAVARRMNNPWVERVVFRDRQGSAMKTLPSRGEGHSPLVAALREGAMVAMLTDQHARLRGMQIPFFGVPASTHTVAARLHLLTGAPILPGYALRTGPMRTRIVFGEPLRFSRTGDREADTRAILTTITARLEAVIRQHPEQYLWSHRRWR